MKHRSNNDILCFLLCLLYVKADGGAATPTTLTKDSISLTLAILFACLILLLMAIVLLYIRRMNPNSFDEALGFHFLRLCPQPINIKGLDSTIISTFPIFSYSDVKKALKSILECAVCLNEFQDEETLRLLPDCCHVFHPQCIDAWLSFRTTCPVCRASLGTKPPGLKKPVQQTGALENSVNSHQATEGSETVREIPRMLSQSQSLIQPGENCERFTLRLPDDIRKRLVDLS